ncbi:MAG: peptidoglycan binding domain-containing protein [bacterium]|nr:peptidoglycan binding domain-containing protein [bacterium]
MSKKVVSGQTNMKRIRMIILGCIALIVTILLIAYLCISQYYKEHFYAQTFINGMDCSNLTAAEARERITENVNTYILNVKERNDVTERIVGADIGLKCTFDQDIDQVLDEQSAYSWILNTWQDNKVDNPYKLTYDEDKLNTVIDKLECLQKENQVEPVNAKVSSYSKDKGFTVIEEKQGTKIDKDKLIAAIQASIKNLDAEVTIEKQDCYVKPEITSTDASIQSTMNTINKYMSTKITYKFGDKTEVFDKTEIGPALKVSKKGKVSIDEDKIEEYVASVAKTYNLIPDSINFKTSTGTQVKVNNVDLGWRLDTDTEQKELIASIKKGEQKQKDPTCKKKGRAYGTSDLVGSTYVEVDLTNQKLYFYKDGKKLLSSNIVTGNPSTGHATPSGAYVVAYKDYDRWLVGPTWRSHVTYWMPFNGGIGLHDASWRHGVFGGKIYSYNGSHGCVNLPFATAKTIYNNIEAGTPVICYK